jgi:universal stress protein A
MSEMNRKKWRAQGPIVVATDLSPVGRRPVELAARLACASGRTLRIVHVIGGLTDGNPLQPAITEAEQVLRARLRTRVESAAAALEDERRFALEVGATTDVELLEGRVWEAILEAAARNQASLIVVGPHGAKGPMHLRRDSIGERILGSTADRVVRHAACATLVCSTEGSQELRGSWLVGVDYSAPSGAALELACALAPAMSAKVTALHIVPESAPRGTPTDDPLALHAQSSPRALELLDELGPFVRRYAGDDASCRIAFGEPSDALAVAASKLGSAMIAIGATGRTGLAHLLLGSTAERTIRRAHVPVLCVPDPER